MAMSTGTKIKSANTKIPMSVMLEFENSRVENTQFNMRYIWLINLYDFSTIVQLRPRRTTGANVSRVP